MPRWWDQVKSIWDLAGQLVELKDRIDELWGQIEQLVEDIKRIDERTRKQNYRERRDEEHRVAVGAQLPAVPVGSRAEVIRAARAKGLMT
jgi:hypothetical protein